MITDNDKRIVALVARAFFGLIKLAILVLLGVAWGYALIGVRSIDDILIAVFLTILCGLGMLASIAAFIGLSLMIDEAIEQELQDYDNKE